jgi:hypothetical protein
LDKTQQTLINNINFLTFLCKTKHQIYETRINVAFGDDFVSWDDLVQELRLYHLSPDNDKSFRRYIDARKQKRGSLF